MYCALSMKLSILCSVFYTHIMKRQHVEASIWCVT